jgi:hypothetical protein
MELNEVSPQGEEKELKPGGQVIFDNLLLWFVLSLVLSLLLYNGWGILELLLVPAAP